MEKEQNQNFDKSENKEAVSEDTKQTSENKISEEDQIKEKNPEEKRER